MTHAKIKLVDSHCHLDFPEFTNKLQEIVEDAGANGVALMQTICTRFSEFEKIYQISRAYPSIFASIGLHPSYVQEERILRAEEICNLISQHKKIIGVGETGLDYYREISVEVRELQKLNFIEHIKAAQMSGLPLIIHSRSAEEDTFQILAEHYEIHPFLAVLHCFTGSFEFAQKCAKLGFYFSLSGIITFNSAGNLGLTVSQIDRDKILVETDAPYLAPVPYRGQINRPSYVKEVARKLGVIMDISYQEVAALTTDNFLRLFTKAYILQT